MSVRTYGRSKRSTSDWTSSIQLILRSTKRNLIGCDRNLSTSQCENYPFPQPPPPAANYSCVPPTNLGTQTRYELPFKPEISLHDFRPPRSKTPLETIPQEESLIEEKLAIGKGDALSQLNWKIEQVCEANKSELQSLRSSLSAMQQQLKGQVNPDLKEDKPEVSAEMMEILKREVEDQIKQAGIQTDREMARVKGRLEDKVTEAEISVKGEVLKVFNTEIKEMAERMKLMETLIADTHKEFSDTALSLQQKIDDLRPEISSVAVPIIAAATGPEKSEEGNLIRSLQAEMEELRSQFQVFKAAGGQTEERINKDLNARLAEYTATNKNEQSACRTEFMGKIEDLERSVAIDRAKQSEAEETGRKSKEVNGNNMHTELEELRTKVEKAKNECEAKCEEFHAAVLTKMEGDAAAISRKIGSLERSLEETNGKLAETQKSCSDISKDSDKLQEQVTNSKESSRKEIETLTKVHENDFAVVNAETEILRKETEETKNGLDSLNSRFENSAKTNANLHANTAVTISALRLELQTLHDSVNLKADEGTALAKSQAQLGLNVGVATIDLVSEPKPCYVPEARSTIDQSSQSQSPVKPTSQSKLGLNVGVAMVDFVAEPKPVIDRTEEIDETRAKSQLGLNVGVAMVDFVAESKPEVEVEDKDVMTVSERAEVEERGVGPSPDDKVSENEAVQTDKESAEPVEEQKEARKQEEIISSDRVVEEEIVLEEDIELKENEAEVPSVDRAADDAKAGEGEPMFKTEVDIGGEKEASPAAGIDQIDEPVDGQEQNSKDIFSQLASPTPNDQRAINIVSSHRESDSPSKEMYAESVSNPEGKEDSPGEKQRPRSSLKTGSGKQKSSGKLRRTSSEEKLSPERKLGQAELNNDLIYEYMQQDHDEEFSPAHEEKSGNPGLGYAHSARVQQDPKDTAVEVRHETDPGAGPESNRLNERVQNVEMEEVDMGFLENLPDAESLASGSRRGDEEENKEGRRAELEFLEEGDLDSFSPRIEGEAVQKEGDDADNKKDPVDPSAEEWIA